MKRLLIASDLNDLFRGEGSFFNRAEISTFPASTNDEMLRICREGQVDLVVTKLDLPGISCEELFKFIRTSGKLKHLSTIILYTDTLANRERCKECSPNAVITLPVEPALLFLKVQQFLNIAPRMNYRAALAVAIAGEFKNTPIQFWTENISASGMLIRAEEPLAKGDGIFFSFFLPKGSHVTGYGEIIRAEKQGADPDVYLFGVKFTNIEAGVRSAIEAAVK